MFGAMRIELVTWRDAGSGDPEKDFTWADAEDVDDENPIVVSVGWVVRETVNNITLAMDRSGEQTHSRSRIPIGMIVSRVVLKEIE